MNKHHEELTHARALRANIVGAPEVWLPRREILVNWLDGFAGRAAKAGYELQPTESDDLRAVEQFLRKHKVPVA